MAQVQGKSNSRRQWFIKISVGERQEKDWLSTAHLCRCALAGRQRKASVTGRAGASVGGVSAAIGHGARAASLLVGAELEAGGTGGAPIAGVGSHACTVGHGWALQILRMGHWVTRHNLGQAQAD